MKKEKENGINLTKVVEEYARIKEMPCRPLNMQSFVHFVRTLTVPLTGTGVLYPRVRDFFILSRVSSLSLLHISDI